MTSGVAVIVISGSFDIRATVVVVVIALPAASVARRIAREGWKLQHHSGGAAAESDRGLRVVEPLCGRGVCFQAAVLLGAHTAGSRGNSPEPRQVAGCLGSIAAVCRKLRYRSSLGS